jgi:hypothetical protein
MQRKVIHVVPEKDGWALQGSGPAMRFSTKNEAINEGKNVAKKANLGQLVVHGQNGKVQTEYTYGKDPRDVEG